MDGAGGISGAVSLVFELFSGCIKGYNLLLEARDVPDAHRYLLIRLRLEKEKLLRWAVLVDLYEDAAKLRPAVKMNRNGLVDSLRALETLLLSVGRGKTASRLSLVASDDSDDEEESMETPTNRKAASVEDILEARAVKHFESIRKSPKRLVYAAFDKPTFERLLVDLHIQNSNLTYWFLDPNDRSHHLKMQEESFMQALQASTRAEDVLGLLSSLRNPPPTSAEISKSNEPVYEAFHREEAAFRRRQLRLTRFKALSLTVHEEGRGEYGRASLAQSQAFSGAKASPTGAQSCSIPIESFSYVDIDSSVECPPRSAAVYKKMSVWVEWNYYQGVSENHEPPRFVEKRIDGLAKLLGDESKPAEFRIPQCLGYVHDVNHGRFGFVFKGRGTPKPLLPLSLRSLLATSKKPSLTKRMVIARTLATAMWYLHSTDWLHMGLSSENVIFNDEAEFAMSVPLLCGFEYARPAAAGEVSSPKNLHHDLYRHPDAQFDVPRNGPVGFRRTFDIYSIGVVLFEIGVWRRADLVLGLNPGNMTQAVVRNTKNKLLAAEALDLLEAETGAVFAGVVRACLLGEFGEERGGNILVEFGKQVVSRLGDIVV